MKRMEIDLVTTLDEKPPIRWYRIDGEAKKRGIAGGIYRVHAGFAGSDERYQAVPRLLKPDPLGRPYIGRADAFTMRFIELMKALNPDLLSDNHGFARSYTSLSAVRARFPLDELRFTLRFSERSVQAEAEELKAYRAEYGELPPFNGAPPGDPTAT
jgi:hypothetical protein